MLMLLPLLWPLPPRLRLAPNMSTVGAVSAQEDLVDRGLLAGLLVPLELLLEMALLLLLRL